MNTQKNFTTRLLSILAIYLVLIMLVAGVLPQRVVHAAGTILLVDTNSDASDIPGDGDCDIDPDIYINQCSLRAAIEFANEMSGAYTIQFVGPMTINVGSQLPTIQTPIEIDGTSAGGWVVLDGGGGSYRGLYIQSDVVVVKGLVITNFDNYGIQTSNALVSPANLQDVSIIGNYIGLNTSGSGTGNSLAGIRLANVDNGIITDNVVRGNGADGVQLVTSPSATVTNNLISGNTGDGLQIGSSSDGTVVFGNTIGTNLAGDTASPNTENGIRLVDSLNVVIGGADVSQRNLISGNTQNGILVTGTVTGSSVQGSYIGTSFDGEADLGNGGDGVRITSGAGFSVGTSSSTGNLISGNNTAGIQIVNASSDISVRDNIIGLDVDGDTPMGNSGNGVNVDSSTIVEIINNVISNNTANGIRIGDGSTAVTVQNNNIGVGATGVGDLGNTSNGVLIEDSDENLIGSTSESMGNIIRYNGLDGVLVTNPEVGTYTAYGNTIIGNSIFQNGDLGIDLAGGRAAATDVDDVDDGPNYQQNTVIGLTAQFLDNGNLQITGSLNTDISRPNYYLEFFVNSNCDAPGYGEGQDRISTQNLVLTGSTTPFSYEISGSGVSVNQYITATVTYDEITGGLKDTSEFSNCAVVQEATSPGSSGVIVVNSTGDEPDEASDGCVTASGTCTLRAAIEFANSGTEPPYTITFSIPGSAPYVITPATPLPAISVPVILNGKPTGYSGAPIVVLDGSAIGATSDGLTVNAANSEINGLSIVNFNRTAVAVSADGVLVNDNYIGLWQDGTNTGPNLNGIYVASSGVEITNNLISGNVYGIRLSSAASNTLIQNNMIGLSASGTLDKGNSDDGVRIEGGSSGNALQGNVISGNGGDGVEISGGGSSNQVYGNLIGTASNGTSSLRNDGHGVNLSGAYDTIISSGNTIANNGGSGVYVGTGSGNLITNSSIYNNSQYGIDLVGTSNNGIGAPIMIQAFWDPSYVFVEGSLSGLDPSSNYTLDLYTNQAGPQGENYVNSVVITTDGSGSATFGVAMPISVPDPTTGTLTLITGTVTDSAYNTSEFSNGVYAVGAAPTLTPSNTPTPTWTFTPTFTYTPTNTSTSPSRTPTKTATSSGGGSTSNTSTPTQTLTPTITETPTLIPAYATLTQLVTEATGAATLTMAAEGETPTATLVNTATPVATETPTGTVDVAATDAAATEAMESILGLDDAGGGTDPEAEVVDDGGLFGLGSGPTMILIIFVGLALLLLIIGGSMELMRWLNSRD